MIPFRRFLLTTPFTEAIILRKENSVLISGVGIVYMNKVYFNKIVQTGIITIFLLSFMTVHSQQQISGKVIDKITREPLELAIVSDPPATRIHFWGGPH
jgi:hypothetical protein